MTADRGRSQGPTTHAPRADGGTQGRQARPRFQQAEELEAFWAKQADELIWGQTWSRVLHWDPPTARWFDGGRLNASVNCLDRHVEAGRGDQPALIWDGQDDASRRLTYAQLQTQVEQTAAGLRDLGVTPGSYVTVYLPNIPEIVVTMLALARIGAPHNVVAGGFSPQVAAHRASQTGSRVLVTADGYLRGDKVVEQKERADQVARIAGCIEHVVVVERLGRQIPWTPDRDIRWDELPAEGGDGAPVDLPAEHPLFVMYTSGTTGAPKGLVHTTGGYLVGVHATSRWVFELAPGRVHWLMADVGWITGHSYGVYGPLATGATLLMTEGLPDHPSPDRPWELVEAHGVHTLYTAPTTIRSLRQHGPSPLEGRDRSSLRVLGSVGEPLDPDTWRWYHDEVGDGRCPVVDTWWQTETGMMIIAPIPGSGPSKPGSVTQRLPGTRPVVVDDGGRPVGSGQTGHLAIRGPWPAMARTILGDHDRYEQAYWSRWDGRLFETGDAARVDDDGDIWLLGREDDTLNVAGHRLGTAQLEAPLITHPAVAEAAVVPKPHPIKGQVPVILVVPAPDPRIQAAHPDLVEALSATLEEAVGPIARPAEVIRVPRLPKTRSGKIPRRLLASIVRGDPGGDRSTLQVPKVLDEVEAAVARQNV